MNVLETVGEYQINPDQSKKFSSETTPSNPTIFKNLLKPSKPETGILLAGAGLASAALRQNPRVGRRAFFKFGAGLAAGSAVALGTSTHIDVAEGASLQAPLLAASFRDIVDLDSTIPVSSTHYDPNLVAVKEPARKMALASANLGRGNEWASIENGIFVPFSIGKYATNPGYGNCGGEGDEKASGIEIPDSATIGGETFDRHGLECVGGLICYGLDRGKDFLWGGEVQPEERPFPMALHHVLIQRMALGYVRERLGLDTSSGFSALVGNFSPDDVILWARTIFGGEMTRYNLAEGRTRVELRLRTSAYQETEPGKDYKDYYYVYEVTEHDPDDLGVYIQGFLRDFWPAAINWDRIASTIDSPIITPDQMIQVPNYGIVRGVTSDGKPIGGILNKTGYVKTFLEAVGKLPR